MFQIVRIMRVPASDERYPTAVAAQEAAAALHREHPEWEVSVCHESYPLDVTP